MWIIDFTREIEVGVGNLLSSDRFRLEPAVRRNLETIVHKTANV
jgi:hypothetical protein